MSERTRTDHNAMRTKTDHNQPAIYKALRKVGAMVIDMSQYRCGFDCLVEYRGRLVLMEIKNPKGNKKLTDKERRVLTKIRNSYIVENYTDAFKAVGAVK